MNSSIHLELHKQLVDFLSGEISVRDFQDWFDPATWDLGGDFPSQLARELIAEIELRLCEFTSGHWSEQELKEKLTPLAEMVVQPVQSWGDKRTRFWTSSANVTLPSSVIRPAPLEHLSPTDTRSALVFS